MSKKKKRNASKSLKAAVKTLGKKGCWGPNVTFTKRGFPQFNQRDARKALHTRSVNIPTLSEDNIKELTGFYADKMQKRLEIFYKESKRIETKVQTILEELAKMDVKVTNLDVNPDVVGKLLNPRIRKMIYSINIEAEHPSMKLRGTMHVSPASVKLSMYSPGVLFNDHIIYIRFYRKMFVKNNIFVSLVKGEKYNSPVGMLGTSRNLF